MENSSEQLDKEEVEKKYRVSLKPQAFSYIAENLRPIYERELEDVRRDGSFKKISSFHKDSRISQIMTSALNQFPDPNTLPQSPFLSLSDKDIKFLEEIIPMPISAQDMMLRREMLREVKDNFGVVKRKENARSISERIKKIFGRKIS